MQRKASKDGLRRKTSMAYMTSEMTAVMNHVADEIADPSIASSLHFSPTALTLVRHVMMTGGTIVTDTALAMADLDRDLLERLNLNVQCFIDDPRILELAAQKRITRAEVALDYALSLPGLKLIAVGSAPAALNRLLQRAQVETLNEVVVIAAPTGFASVVQLKERIWDSDLASIVVRGKKGGASVVVAILNALMMESARQQKL